MCRTTKEKIELNPSSAQYLKGREAAVEALNALVAKKTKDSAPNKEDLEDRCFEAVRQGATVYKNRALGVTVFAWFVTAVCLAQSESWRFLVAAMLVSNLFVDFYGGVLHVVLDHPAFIGLPLIGEACLEFQWHHHIPHDITSRSYIQIAADLNVIVLVILAFFLSLHGFHPSSKALTVLGGISFNAYLGQWAHRQAHFVDEKRHPVAKVMQKGGMLVDPLLHREHHRTYLTGFPILTGVTNGLVDFLLYMIPDRRIWLVVFAVMTLGAHSIVSAILDFFGSYSGLQA